MSLDGTRIQNRSFFPEAILGHALLVLIILIRKELSGHGELHAVTLCIGEPIEFDVKINRRLMPSPNSSSISAFQAGPFTITSS
jgi:hypothetical protein